MQIRSRRPISLVIIALAVLIVAFIFLLVRNGGSGPSAVVTPTPTRDSLGEFFLDVLTPAEAETVVAVSPIVISGRTRADALVTINDEVVPVGLDGTFGLSVSLHEGPNIVEVVASAEGEAQLEAVLAVIHAP